MCILFTYAYILDVLGGGFDYVRPDHLGKESTCQFDKKIKRVAIATNN